MSSARFAELYRAAAKGLWCIAVAVLKDRTAAQDVVQDASMIALAKRGEFDEGTSFAAWAGQIVRFTALNELRRRQRDRAAMADSALAGMAGSGTSPSRVAQGAGAALDPRLAAALDTLDETARACLLMRTVMDMGYKEIAASLSIPEGTAMSHVHRSRQSLRTLLADSSLAPGGPKGERP
ncbi:MAG: RNA polymerase sigma factor [Phycisphaerales bacterium]